MSTSFKTIYFSNKKGKKIILNIDTNGQIYRQTDTHFTFKIHNILYFCQQYFTKHCLQILLMYSSLMSLKLTSIKHNENKHAVK